MRVIIVFSKVQAQVEELCDIRQAQSCRVPGTDWITPVVPTNTSSTIDADWPTSQAYEDTVLCHKLVYTSFGCLGVNDLLSFDKDDELSSL